MDYKVTPNENWGILNYLPIKFNIKVPTQEFPLDNALKIILPSSEIVPVGTSLIFIINRIVNPNGMNEGRSTVISVDKESAAIDLINFSVSEVDLPSSVSEVDMPSGRTVAYEAKLIEKGNWSVTRTAFIEQPIEQMP